MAETVRFSRDCIAAPHGSALTAGQAILAQGGNAIEAPGSACPARNRMR